MLALALLVLGSTCADAAADGKAWLEKSEARLYAWPKPGSLVRFQVRTDMLDAAIAEMEKDPAVAAEADKRKWVDALKHVSIRGALDTETGALSTEVELRYEPESPQGKAAADKMKSGLSSTISNAFQGLPLHDPRLFRAGGAVISSEVQGEAVLVTMTGRTEGSQTVVRINQRSALPESIDTGECSTRYGFTEVVPGRFAPARLDVRIRSGKESRAEYTYQRAGDLVFPATIQVSQGSQSATFTFVSLKVEPRPRG